jgi:hypothetical protein
LGVRPFSVTDFLSNGTCFNSAITTGPYSSLCFGHNSSGSGIISLDSFNGAPLSQLLFSVNGAIVPVVPGTVTTGKAVVASNAVLQATASTFAAAIERTDYSIGFGAPPLTYTPSAGACSLNGGNGDNGSQVRSSDGKCWLATFGAHPIDVREFGADPTGVSDAAAALNACLAAAGPGRSCTTAGAKLLLSGANITIPGGSVLDCGNAFTDQGEALTGLLGTMPALMLSSVRTIVSGGEGSTIKNCLIYRSGMTFPAPNASGFAGLAVSDSGGGSLTLTDNIIVGFDSCALIAGVRPVVDRLWCDAQGASHAALDIENGNTDSGTFTNIKIQPFATGNYGAFTSSCADITRTGTGLKNNGINFLDKVVVQNFRTTDIEIHGGFGGALWSDFITVCNTAYPTSKGFYFPNASTDFKHINANGSGIGILFNNGGAIGGVNTFGSVFLNALGGDCIQVGDTGANGGVINIGVLQTNGANVTTSLHNCGNNGAAPGGTGYVINYRDTTGSSVLHIRDGYLQNVASTPYINIPPLTTSTNAIDIHDRINTDLTLPASLYTAPIIQAPTGFGSGGACVFLGNTRTTPWKGTMRCTYGTGASAAVSVTLQWPLILGTSAGCTVTPLSPPSAPTSAYAADIGFNQTTFSVVLGGAPSAAATMNIAYKCDPQ